VVHGFTVFLSNPEKTEFTAVDTGTPMGEMRSFTWSPDGKQLTIVGNTMGSGHVLVTDLAGGQVEYLLSNSGVGYLMDAVWSRDGKQLAMWSSQNNQVLSVLNAEGTDVVKKQLDVYIQGTPQFLPDGSGVIFYGADSTSAGLFQMMLEDSEAILINPLVRDGSAYAFSPDASSLAYMEYDQDTGEARLTVENLATGGRSVLGMFPIPKTPGSSLPDTANLSWSADGKSLVFDFGRLATDRAIYLAPTDGTGMIKVTEAAYAPSISADGKCLAYISDRQVFLMDLSAIASDPTAQPPVLLADLPTGSGIPNVKQDKLQWKP
jgi:Tol biopolymer transport system component